MRITNIQDNHTNFSGKNIFVNPEKFEQLFKEHINEINFVDFPWNITSAKIGTNYLGTKEINTCTCIAMNNGKGILQHYSTDECNFQSIPTIKKIIDIVNKKSPIVSTLLIGSKSQSTPIVDLSYLKKIMPKELDAMFKPIYDENSSKLFQELKKIVIDFKPTIIEGHKNANSNTNIIQDIKNNTNYILTLIDARKNIYVKNNKDLDIAFENVTISPNDTIEFLG